MLFLPTVYIFVSCMIHRIRWDYLSKRINYLVIVMETQCVVREVGTAFLKYYLCKYEVFNIYIYIFFLSFEILTVLATKITVFCLIIIIIIIYYLWGGTESLGICSSP
jgi:hypothetical protein